jgi:hypothetical protein
MPRVPGFWPRTIWEVHLLQVPQYGSRGPHHCMIALRIVLSVDFRLSDALAADVGPGNARDRLALQMDKMAISRQYDNMMVIRW